MALIKFGGGIVGMSGSIAGTTFARNRYGSYARSRTKPINPNTGRQQAVRAAIAFLTVRWSATLTGLQRAAWNLYADNVNMKNRLGETVNLSGFNHYIRSNAIRKQRGHTIIDAGPVVFELPEQDPTYAITASEATQIISNAFDVTADWSTEDGAYIYFFQGLPQNAQRNFFAGPWRWHGWTAGIDPGGAASPEGSAVQYAIAEGQRVWNYARISRADGRLSEPFRSDCAVGA